MLVRSGGLWVVGLALTACGSRGAPPARPPVPTSDEAKPTEPMARSGAEPAAPVPAAPVPAAPVPAGRAETTARTTPEADVVSRKAPRDHRPMGELEEDWRASMKRLGALSGGDFRHTRDAKTLREAALLARAMERRAFEGIEAAREGMVTAKDDPDARVALRKELRRWTKRAVSMRGLVAGAYRRLTVKQVPNVCEPPPGPRGAGVTRGCRDEAMYHAGYSYELARRWEDAAEQYARLVQDYPQSKFLRHAIFGLGEVSFRQGRLEEASGFFAEVAAMPPHGNDLHEYARYRTAQIHAATGKKNEAKRAFEELADYLENAQGRLNRALLRSACREAIAGL